jgi:UDP-N-acetylglucosamine 2-epimerase (non-hydrolysing)
MIAFVFGTTAELIKLAPVADRLDRRGVPYRWWCTGQQVEELPVTIAGLGVREPDRWLGRGWAGHSLHRPGDVARWAARLVRTVASRRRALRAELAADGTPPVVVVHGDTMTTVLGALVGRVLGATVVHVEAGMRSGDWRNPFPEELDRRMVARIADVHFAPGARAVGNLRRARGTVVDTGANTVVDALGCVPVGAGTRPATVPPRFGLVSLHRSELYGDPVALEAVLGVLADEARRPEGMALVFVDHPVTCARITELGLDPLLAPMVRIPKLDYASFVTLVRDSAFVVTDSGGLQQECAELGHPCAVHRTTTESPEGIGANVVVTGGRLDALRAFLDDPQRHRCAAPARVSSPSDVVVDWLCERGLVGTARRAVPR